MLDEKGYVSEASQNLIEGVQLDDFEADPLQGDGNGAGGKVLCRSFVFCSSSKQTLLHSRPSRLKCRSKRILGRDRWSPGKHAT